MDDTYGGVADFVKINQLLSELDDELVNYRNAGYQLANNEAEYRMALNIKILEERSIGTPVTIINDLCRGDEKIALLRQLRDSAEVEYNTCREKINAIKLAIRIKNDQIAREWARPSNM